MGKKTIYTCDICRAQTYDPAGWVLDAKIVAAIHNPNKYGNTAVSYTKTFLKGDICEDCSEELSNRFTGAYEQFVDAFKDRYAGTGLN